MTDMVDAVDVARSVEWMMLTYIGISRYHHLRTLPSKMRAICFTRMAKRLSMGQRLPMYCLAKPLDHGVG